MSADFVRRVAWDEGDVRVVEVAPDALLRYRNGVETGAAWRSLTGETWKAWRPDRGQGLVQRGLPSRLQAVMYLAAVIPDAA